MINYYDKEKKTEMKENSNQRKNGNQNSTNGRYLFYNCYCVPKLI